MRVGFERKRRQGGELTNEDISKREREEEAEGRGRISDLNPVTVT